MDSVPEYPIRFHLSTTPVVFNRWLRTRVFGMAADPIIGGGAEWCAIAGMKVWQNMDAYVFDVFGARHALFGAGPDVTPIDEPILRFELLPLETPRAELTIHSPHPLAASLLDRLLSDFVATWPAARDTAASAMARSPDEESAAHHDDADRPSGRYGRTPYFKNGADFRDLVFPIIQKCGPSVQVDDVIDGLSTTLPGYDGNREYDSWRMDRSTFYRAMKHKYGCNSFQDLVAEALGVAKH
jgi:hypothetical protein